MDKPALALAALLFLAAIPAVSANTTARVEGCEIIITLNLAFAGPGANQSYLDKVNQSVTKYWNTGMTYGECKCKVKVEANMVIVQNCTPPAQGRHCVTVKKTNGFHRSTVSAGTWRSPSVGSGTGDWGSNDGETVIAHEVGHLLGLGDDYYDYYAYQYFYANGTNASGVMTVNVSDYNQTRANEINNSAPPGSTPGFAHNNATCNYSFSTPKPGADPNGLMAGIGPNAKVTQKMIDDLCGKAGAKCPDYCCCGNGKKDSMEQCDPGATPSGCAANQACQSNCTCAGIQTTPRCGDGQLYRPPNYGQPGVGGEECDWNATPTGCQPDEFCDSTCKCCGRSVTITNPASGSTVSGSTPVRVGYDYCGGAPSRVGFYLDGVLRHTDFEAPFLWNLNPEDYAPGTYVLMVVAFDGEGQAQAMQEITIARAGSATPAPTAAPTATPAPTEPPVPCGNGVCDTAIGEDCTTCPPDCVCPMGASCMPLSPVADPMGCVTGGGACGDGACVPGEFCYTCPADCRCPDNSDCIPEYPDYFGCKPSG
ncbi:MAG: Ig-like domain-containing protein [Candidatus ainarchaeum sp.]|nr:Ig-like domain-containing protein [Candidatus ainarchaeum sp.]